MCCVAVFSTPARRQNLVARSSSPAEDVNELKATVDQLKVSGLTVRLGSCVHVSADCLSTAAMGTTEAGHTSGLGAGPVARPKIPRTWVFIFGCLSRLRSVSSSAAPEQRWLRENGRNEQAFGAEQY